MKNRDSCSEFILLLRFVLLRVTCVAVSCEPQPGQQRDVAGVQEEGGGDGGGIHVPTVLHHQQHQHSGHGGCVLY